MDWRYAHTALALCAMAFMATMIARLAISPVVPLITADLAVSNTAIGVALTGMWVAYALTQFPSGVLGDRFGERVVILTALAGTALTSLVIAGAGNIVVFALGTVCLGVAAGLHYTTATTFLAKQFDDIGRAIGIHLSGGPIAGLLAPPVAAMIGARYGWRPALLLGTAAAVPAFGLFAWRVRSTEPTRPDQRMRSRFELEPLLDLLRRPSIAFTTVLSVLGAFTWQATASFLPTFLAVGGGLSTTMAGVLFSVYFVVHGLTQPVIGWFSDRAGRDAAAMLTMAAGVVGYGLLVWTVSTGAGLVPLAGGTVIIGLSMSWGPTLQSRFMDQLGPDERGAGFGLVRTVYMVVGASGSVVVGAVSDLAGWEVAFGLLVLVMGVSLATLSANRVFELGF